jgi:vacuolar-type H+-ATPase subunit E/Vma4
MPLDMNDPEVKAALKAAAEEARKEAADAAAEAAQKLADNNADLLKQLRAARKEAAIDPAEFAKLEDENATLKSQLTDVQKTVAKVQKETGATIENLTKQLASETGFTQQLLKDNGLSDALVKAGVTAPMMPAVKAMLEKQVSIVADGDTRKAVVGDKPLTDYVAEWAASDAGKHFVAAPVNSGGGAPGGSGGGGGTKVIQAGDTAAFGANIADIASGKAVVQ